MLFKVLGCSGSECDRNHPCSFLIGDSLIVDMGSAASRLSIEQQSKITDVVLSHAHLDHTKDLAFFCENVFKHAKYPIRIRGGRGTLDRVKNHLLNNHIWPDFSALPDTKNPMLKYEAIEPRTVVRLKDVEVFAIPVNHPGGCEAHFFSTPAGTVLYTGDSGPTDEVWGEVKKRKKQMKAILLETSFSNNQEALAEVSGHLTPKLFAEEIKKMGDVDCPIFAYHLKAPYLEQTKKELEAIGDPRIHILEPGMKIEF